MIILCISHHGFSARKPPRYNVFLYSVELDGLFILIFCLSTGWHSHSISANDTFREYLFFISIGVQYYAERTHCPVRRRGVHGNFEFMAMAIPTDKRLSIWSWIPRTMLFSYVNVSSVTNHQRHYHLKCTQYIVEYRAVHSAVQSFNWMLSISLCMYDIDVIMHCRNHFYPETGCFKYPW